MAERGGRWSISRAAVLITALTAISTILGLVRDIVIGAVFGAGPELDAYLVGLGLMNIVLGMIAGAMAKSVTPVIARESAAEEMRMPGRHRHVGFDVAFSVTMVVLGVVGVLMWIFVAPVTAVLAPGFDPAQAELSQSLTRIVLAATVLVAATNLLASLAHAHGRFTWSALEGVPFNIVMIIAAAVFGPTYGITVLAVGFVVGSALRLLLQLPPIRQLKLRILPGARLSDPSFREIVRLIPALLVGSAIGNVNTLVDRAVASTVAEGAISALSYGWRLVSLPETLIIASLLIPLYAAMGASSRNIVEVRRLVGRGLSATVTVLTPICVVMVVCARPLVDLAFGYGEFDADDEAATSIAVAWYAPALLALGVREVVIRASYSLGNATSPVVVAVIAMALNVAGDILLAPIYGLSGIAFSTTASLIFAALANGWILARRHRAIERRSTLPLLGRAALLTALSLAAASGVQAALISAGMPDLVLLVAVTAVVVLIYGGGLVLLRAPERLLLAEVVAAMTRRRER